MQDPVTTTQAGEIANRHKRTIVAWIRRGMLPAQKLPGMRGQYLIARKDLEDLLVYLNTPQPYVPNVADEKAEHDGS